MLSPTKNVDRRDFKNRQTASPACAARRFSDAPVLGAVHSPACTEDPSMGPAMKSRINAYAMRRL